VASREQRLLQNCDGSTQIGTHCAGLTEVEQNRASTRMQFPSEKIFAVADRVCIVRSTQKINEIKRECPASRCRPHATAKRKNPAKSCGETSPPAETSAMP
jgi:hypothetical protein